MSKRWQGLVGIMAVTAALLLLGFVLFATAVMRDPAPFDPTADAIVVLTGGDARIVEGARLLREGRGKRLLVSGVDRKATREDVHRISGLRSDLFNCCVDTGYEALDTVGNAAETRDWATTHGYKRLIIVTASYHMPRSLVELERVLPGAELIPHPVVPKSFRVEAWWLHVATVRVLLSEYLKYLPSVLRLTIERATGGAVSIPLPALRGSLIVWPGR